VEDLCRAYGWVLNAADEQVRGEVFNVAHSDGNCRVMDIADAVTDIIPGTSWSAANAAPDERSYRVDGAKLSRAFPGLAFQWTLSRGIRQLAVAIRNAGLTAADWRSDRYRRSQRLRSLIEHGDISADFRRAGGVLV
jgi:nucleoside-diphosphate-sugar epimerase